MVGGSVFGCEATVASVLCMWIRKVVCLILFLSPFSFSRSSLSGNAMAVELADSFISRAARVSLTFILSGS